MAKVIALTWLTALSGGCDPVIQPTIQPTSTFHPHSNLTTLVPPFRFSLLAAGPADPACPLYRGSLPKPVNLPFLSTLNLKTVISLCPKSLKHYEENGDLPVRKQARVECEGGGEDQEESVGGWISRNRVRVVTVKVGKAKDGAIPFGTSEVKQTLELLVDQSNYPIYIHDLDGSDVLAIMCAALRKLQGWSDPAWTTEMSRQVTFLKQPPPESEHLTFLRRLLSSPPHPSTPADEAGLSIHIPPPPQRIPWLWPLGRPTGKGRMRVTVDEGEFDPTVSLAASTTSTLSRKPDLSASAMERALTASAAHHPNAHVRHLTEGLQFNGTDSLPTSRAWSATPSHGRWASMVPSVAGTPVASAPGSAHGGSRPTSEAGEEAGDEDEDEGSQGGQVGDGEEGGGGEFEGDDDEDGEEEEEEDEEEEEEVEPLSRTVEALDLF